MADPHAVWRRNTPFLYEVLVGHTLEWPSLTVAWLPPPANAPATQAVVLATHTGGREPNALLVADIDVPTQEATSTPPRLLFRHSIPHDGEVHTARVNPARPTLVATRSPRPAVPVYDLALLPEHCLLPAVAPTAQLLGHTKGGYGLAWHPTRESVLLSGGEDGLVLAWDLTRAAEPLVQVQGHKGAVESVAWHAHHQWLFGTVGDDFRLNLWDMRRLPTPYSSVEAHQRDVNCVAFSQHAEFLLVTCSADHTCALWDTRRLSARDISKERNDVAEVQDSEVHSLEMCISIFCSNCKDVG